MIKNDEYNHKLNEDNIAQVFQLDAELGKNDFVKKTGTMILDPMTNPKVHMPLHGNTMCVELGYSIDFENINDLTFKIKNQRCAVRTVSYPSELQGKSLSDNEVYLVTEHPFFRTVVYISTSVKGDTSLFYFEITTLNSALSVSDFNYIAKKLNALDLKYINDSFTTLDGRVTESREFIQKNIVSLQTLKRKTAGIERLKKSADGEKDKFETKITDKLSAEDIDVAGAFTVSIIDAVSVNADREINANGDIGTRGNIIAEGFAIAKEISAADRMSTKDFKITGNVDGELTDGTYKFQKFIRAVPKTLTQGYSDVEVLIYPNGDCVVTGILTETTNQNVNVGALSAPVSKVYPCLIDNLKYVSYNSVTPTGAKFIVTLATNDSSILNILYRNISSSREDIIATKLYFTLKGIKTSFADINII